MKPVRLEASRGSLNAFITCLQHTGARNQSPMETIALQTLAVDLCWSFFFFFLNQCQVLENVLQAFSLQSSAIFSHPSPLFLFYLFV